MRLESAIRTPIALEVAADEGHISKAPGNKRIDGAIVGSGSRVYKETLHRISNWELRFLYGVGTSGFASGVWKDWTRKHLSAVYCDCDHTICFKAGKSGPICFRYL